MSSSPGPERVRWQLRSAGALKIARFDQEALVFNPLSWQTHLVNDTAVRVLEALLSKPHYADELFDAIAGPHLAPEETVENRHAIDALLVELEGLGLIEATSASCD